MALAVFPNTSGSFCSYLITLVSQFCIPFNRLFMRINFWLIKFLYKMFIFFPLCSMAFPGHERCGARRWWRTEVLGPSFFSVYCGIPLRVKAEHVPRSSYDSAAPLSSVSLFLGSNTDQRGPTEKALLAPSLEGGHGGKYWPGLLKAAANCDQGAESHRC